MINNQDQMFLSRELSRLLPDVFFHPIWTQFLTNLPKYAPDLVQNLLHNLQPEQTQGDPATKCQVIFLCAFLHSRLDNHAGAQVCLEQVLNLAEANGLEHIYQCAVWGCCAVCIRKGKYEEAAHWLFLLRKKLQEGGNWILANILELFTQILEDQVRTKDFNGEYLEWLLRWGEWPTTVEFLYNLDDSHSDQPIDSHIMKNFLRLIRRWRSFWHVLKHIFKKMRTRQSLSQQEVRTRTYQNQRNELSQLTVSQYDQIPFTLSIDLLQEKLSSSLKTPNALNPDPLTQSKLSLGRETSLPAKKGMSSLAVYCLGPFRVYHDDQSVTTWPSGKGKAIFKYMIANLGRPVHKDILIDTFWRETDFESARKNLYVAIYGLRQAFKFIQPYLTIVLFQDDHYLINPAIEVWLDIKKFVQHYQSGQNLERSGKLVEAMGEYEKADCLYQGDFLEEDLYEDWLIPRREGLKDSYLSIIDRLSQYNLEEKRYATCIQFCQKILAKDDCREDAHRRLMRCYSRQGQRNLALRQYYLCVEILARVLSVLPTPETTTLYHRILGGDTV